MPVQSHDAEQMIQYQKLVDKVLKNETADEAHKVRIAKKNKIKIGAPELPRAGTREPRLK